MNILGRSRISQEPFRPLSFWLANSGSFWQEVFQPGSIYHISKALEAGVWLCLCHSWGSAASDTAAGRSPGAARGSPSYSSLFRKEAEQQLLCVLVVIHETRDGRGQRRNSARPSSPNTTIFWKCCGRNLLQRWRVFAAKPCWKGILLWWTVNQLPDTVKALSSCFIRSWH